MVSHTYQFHLESNVIRLPNVDDLLGKNVEVTIREIGSADSVSNFEVINHLLAERASKDFFKAIDDPTSWQKKMRDEWE